MSKFTVKRPERDVPLCLEAGLQADWEAAERDLTQARKVPSEMMTGNPEVARLAQVIADLEARMAGEVVTFRLRALPRSKWAELLAKNPPRPDHAEDASFGGNREGFFDDALTYVDPKNSATRTIVGATQGGEPVDFDPETDWSDLADEMTDRQYTDFADAVFVLNRGSVSVPFSRAASQVNRASSETSK